MYVVTIVIDGRQLPTFFLCQDMMGIVSEDHACRIARKLVGGNPDANIVAIRQ